MDKARIQSPDKFAGTVRKYEQERSCDDGMGRLEHQRSRRFARIKTDLTDGMTVLYGGSILSRVLCWRLPFRRRWDELWREEDPQDRATPGQRMADALAQLVTREDTDEDGGRVRGPRLLLIADYDAIGRELRNGRLGDGTPIPVEKIRDLACQADVLPAIFRGGVTAIGPRAVTADRQPRPTGRSRRQGQGLCGMRRHRQLVPSTPHNPLGGARPNRPRRHVPPMQQVPPQSPRRPMASTQNPQPANTTSNHPRPAYDERFIQVIPTTTAATGPNKENDPLSRILRAGENYTVK